MVTSTGTTITKKSRESNKKLTTGGPESLIQPPIQNEQSSNLIRPKKNPSKTKKKRKTIVK